MTNAGSFGTDGTCSHPRTGRRIQVSGRMLHDFASCSYLGLERRPELARAAAEAAHRYGTQLSMSRACHECELYRELESKLETVADRPVLLGPSMPLVHRAALSVLVGDEDAVLIDQFAHASLLDAAASIREVPVRRVRHSRMDRLEEVLEQLAPEHELLWLIVDGLYPMFGDFAPFDQLAGLLVRWPQLRLYVDDSHAAGWLGPHGRGGALTRLGHLSQVFVAFSLNKSFAATGAALAFPDGSQKMRVRGLGGPMLFSGSIQPPMLGAAVASVDLHLVEEHCRVQAELFGRIDYTLALAKHKGLPLVAHHRTPIFFVPCDSM